MEVIEITRIDKYYQEERKLRNLVLLRPIGLPDFGWEKFDHIANHFVMIEENKVIGCVLLVKKENGRAQLMQMAVEPSNQRKGIGKELLECLLEFAQKIDLKEVYCHARENAVPFYLKNNFNIYDDQFEEVGIVHRYMKFTF